MAELQNELENDLSKLKVKELKELAKERNINISGCKTKKEYIARIVSHMPSQHAELITEDEIETEEDGGVVRKDVVSPHDSDGEIETILKEVTTMTDEEIAEVDERLNSVKDKTVEFTDMRDMQRRAEFSKNKRQYPDLMAHLEASISRGEARFRRFQGIGLSLAILSSEKTIDSFKSLGIGVDYPASLLLEAKRDFALGDYDDASSIVVKIRDLTMNLHREYREKLENRLGLLSARIRDTENIGADMGNVNIAMADATKTLEDDRLLDCSSLLDRLESAINDSWIQRTALIRVTIEFVATLIEDARDIGGDVKEAKEKLEDARKLFDEEKFQECIEMTIEAEKVVTELIRQQAQRAQTLLKTLEERYSVASADTHLRRARVETSISGLDLVESKKPCPACGKALSFIEKYNRWYCYSCEQYA